jgi:hypothetical protein
VPRSGTGMLRYQTAIPEADAGGIGIGLDALDASDLDLFVHKHTQNLSDKRYTRLNLRIPKHRYPPLEYQYSIQYYVWKWKIRQRVKRHFLPTVRSLTCTVLVSPASYKYNNCFAFLTITEHVK